MRPMAMLPVATIIACSDATAPAPPATPAAPVITRAASAYLDTALLYTSQSFYYRATVNWQDVRSRLFARAGAAQTLAATYPAIDSMLIELGDVHSFFLPPSQTIGSSDDPATPFYRPLMTTFTPRLAYLWIPRFFGVNAAGRADTLQSLVARADSVRGLCGWIIDLRGNMGGSWPAMVAGMSALIPPGPGVGWFADSTLRYFYVAQPGYAGLSVPPSGSNPRRTIDYLRLAKPYTVADSTLPIAILQSSLTASAGELLMLMLRGGAREVRTFGTPSYGATSQPFTFTMRDGASLIVTAGLMFDRSGRTYYHRTGGEINPDEPTGVPSAPPDQFVPGAQTDAGIDAATAWLNARPSCRSAPRPAGYPRRTSFVGANLALDEIPVSKHSVELGGGNDHPGRVVFSRNRVA